MVGETRLARRSYATAQVRPVSGLGQTRFLKRQLSLPVSTMSQ